MRLGVTGLGLGFEFFFIIGLWECQGGVGRGGIEGGWVGDIGRLELFPSFCVA